MTTDYEYTSMSNNKERVRSIKQAAIFFDVATLPTSTDWKPGENEKPLGYLSEDGITLHPEAGDSDEIKGHNGDTIYNEATGGNWTLQLSAVESSKTAAALYFGVTPGDDGTITLDDATVKGTHTVVLAGLDQKGKPIIVVGYQATVSDRDDITFKAGELVQFNITLSLAKAAGGHMLSIFGAFDPETEPKKEL